ncbi:hypothetical protein DCAR_0728130 [Daucus carota subsp. sativus]|uniref:TMEM205-like domain-containing protein n=1 Tax=Daucus carota subsp. sativus TaxID=79200 RepID=A0A164T8I7_DAUCS|nr:hypothetical protein DCAR_0728130 [Daucus carota subsp. sativus]
MMNGVALLLILGSVCSGIVWSPEVSQNNQNSNIIIKEGHSVVVVEYVGEGKEGKTKVSIYPKDYYDGLEKVEEAKEFVSENVGKVKNIVVEGRGKVMDGVDKVKEVVGEGSSKVKDKVKEVAGEGSSKVKDGAHEVKEFVDERSSRVKDEVHKIKEAVGERSSKVKDGAHKVKELVGEGSEKVKDAAHKVIESDTMETPRRALEDIKSNLSNLADIDRHDIEEVVCDAFGKCKQGLEKVEGATKVGVTKGVGKMKEVVADGSSKVKDVTEKVKDSGAMDTPKRGVEDIQRNVSMIGDTIEAPRMNSLMGVVQLLGFSISFGMSMWMTFVSCYILGDALPREQFGMLQSKLYPIYYKIQAYSTGVALMAHLFSRGKKIVSSSAEIFYSINLVMSLLMSLGNFLYLEPKATQIMSERFKVEKEEGREGVTSHPRSGIADDAGDPVTATTEQQGEVRAETHTARLSEKLQMINRISSYANIAALISLSMHMVYLGLHIQVLKMLGDNKLYLNINFFLCIK